MGCGSQSGFPLSIRGWIDVWFDTVIDAPKLAWSRLLNSDDAENDVVGLRKKGDEGGSVESLDYEIIENYAYWEEHAQRGKLYVGYYVAVKWFPAQSDLQKQLRGRIPKEVADRLSSLRNQIVFVAEDTDGSAISELRRGLEEYLSLLIGLTKKEYGLEGLVEFKWRSLDNGKHQDGSSSCVANSWFEVLSVVHMMAMLALSEADTLAC